MYPVAGSDDKIALGDDNFPAPFHRAEQHLGQLPVLFIHFLQGHAHHRVALRSAEIHHFHPAPGEGFNAARGREAQHAADFPGGGPLRVDGVVDGQLLLQKGQAGQVFRVADDGVLRAQALGRQAGQHIDFIAHGGGDHDISVGRVRFPQRVGADAAALDEHGVQGIHIFLQHHFAALDHGHIMAFVHQMLRQGDAQLSPANHNDLHDALQAFKVPSTGVRFLLIISGTGPFEKRKMPIESRNWEKTRFFFRFLSFQRRKTALSSVLSAEDFTTPPFHDILKGQPACAAGCPMILPGA